MAASGAKIFMDIMPRLPPGELEAAMRAITARFSALGSDINRSLGSDVGRAASTAAERNAAQIERSMQAAQASVARSTEAMIRAQDSQIASATRVRAAQANYNEVMAKGYEESSSRAISALGRLESAQATAAANTRAMTAAMNENLTAQARAAEASRDQEAATAAAAAGMGTLGRAAAVATVGVGIGLAGAFVVGVDGAAKLQEKMRLVQTTGDESNATMEEMKQKVLDLQSHWGYSATTISEALRSIEQAGYRGSDAMKILDTSVKGAHSEHADLNETAKQLTTTMHDFSFSADQSSTAMSKSVEAVFLAKTNLSDYSRAIGQVEKTAMNAKVSIDDMNAAVAMSTQHGASIEDAANRWSHAIQTMQSMQGPQTDTINQLGFTQKQIQDMMADPKLGVGGTMEEIQKAILARRDANGNVHLGTAKISADATAAEKEAYGALDTLDPTGTSKKIATQFRTSGNQSDESWGHLIGHLAAPEQNALRQWKTVYDKSTGLSANIRKGKPDEMSVEQAMKLAFGDMPTLSAAMDVVGNGEGADPNKNFNEYLSKRSDMGTLGKPEANGDPKGSAESQQTLMAQLHNLRGSISSVLTEEGGAAIAPLTDFIHALASATQWLGSHVGAMQVLTAAAVTAAITLGAIKVTNMVGGLFNSPLAGTNFAGRVAGGVGRGVGAAGRGIGQAGAIGYNYAGSLAADGAAAASGLASRGATAARTSRLGSVGRWGARAGIAGAGVGGLMLLSSGSSKADDGSGDGSSGGGTDWQNMAMMGLMAAPALPMVGSLASGAVSAGSKALDFGGTAAKSSAAAIGNATKAIKEFEVGAKLAATATKVWEGVQAAFDVVMTANPIGLIVVAIAALVAGVIYAYTHFQWFRDAVDKSWQYIKGFAEWIGHEFMATWNTTFDFLKKLWSDVYEKVFKFEIDLIKGYLTSFVDFFKNTGNGIGKVLSGIKDLFSGNVDGIRKIWDGLKQIAAAPIKFIVESVYNNGIVKLWNGVAGVFGLGPMTPLQLNFSGGGMVPGYHPGQDSVHAMLSPGEGVAVPELVQAIGPSNFMALNHKYSKGRPSANETAGLPIPHAEGGGIFGSIGNAVNPAAGLRDSFGEWIGKALGAPGQGLWRDALVTFPQHVLNAAIDSVKGMVGIGGGTGSSGGSSGPTGSGRGAEQWRTMAMQALVENGFTPPEKYIDAMLAQIMTESSGNDKIIQQVKDVNSGGNEAAGILQVTPGTFAQYRNPNDPNDRFDAKANMDAALRYMRGRYHGDINGVWGHGHGYAGGGIADPNGVLDSKNTGVNGSERRGEGAPSSLPKLPNGQASDDTAIRRALGWVNSVAGTPYAYGPGELDCSGFLSGVYEQLLGHPAHRAFTTVSDFLNLGFKRGLGGVFDIGVTPKPGLAGHMAGTLAGHNIESGGSHGNIAIDGPAAGANDPQFSEHYFLPGEMFTPPYYGKGANSTTPAGKFAAQSDRAAEQAQKKRDAAKKYLEDAQTAENEAQKHLEKMRQHQNDAADAAKKASEAILDVDRQKYEKQAKTAQDAADNAKDAASKAGQRAQSYRDKAAQAEGDATSLTNKSAMYKERSARGDTTGTGTGSKANANHLMTPVEFGQQLGGLAVGGLLETFGLENTIFADPNKSAFARIGNAVANSKYVGPQNMLGAQESDDPYSAYDSQTDSSTDTSFDTGLDTSISPSDYLSPDLTDLAPSIGVDPQNDNPMGQAESDPQFGKTPPGSPQNSPSGSREPNWGGTPQAPGVLGQLGWQRSGPPAAQPSGPNGGREPGWGGSPMPAPAPVPQRPGSAGNALLDYLNGVPTHDEGGWIKPGLQLINNLTGRPEPVLNPRQKDNLDKIANRGGSDSFGSDSRATVHIENQHIHDGDFRKASREWTREMNAYAGGGMR